MIRVRFAPSPTGYLHVGGARTALYNWLFAKNQGGKFFLRVEDTDLERSSTEMVDVIIDSMKWLGLSWDGEIVYQTSRINRYREVAERLVAEGRAYRCFCSKEELDRAREICEKKGETYRYDGRCRERKESGDGLSAIRLKVDPAGETFFTDRIYGEIRVKNSELDDFIILRSNNSPTYNFAVVVDDADMEITHVIRGNDHLSNTPKQLNIYAALDHVAPQFAHLPMINGPDGKKLSKRHGAQSVEAFREMGVLPEALVNYLARLGWSHGDEEIFSVPDLIGKFSLDNVNKSAAIFDTEKLFWLSGRHLKKADPELVFSLVRTYLLDKRLAQEREITEQEADLRRLIGYARDRHRTVNELSEALVFYFTELEFEPEKAEKHFTSKGVELWEKIFLQFANLPDYSEETVEREMRRFLGQIGCSLKEIAQPLRYALTFSEASPGLFETISCLGRKKNLDRIERVIEYIKERE
ncbi:MAG: glutamate--tRNA ligase [Candidatus Wallbacteria bacterium]|nr:glutamate--tRNA ligase [Candidatus Wallbacteria bacterium]